MMKWTKNIPAILSLALGVSSPGATIDLVDELIMARDKWTHKMWLEYLRMSKEEGSKPMAQHKAALLEEWEALRKVLRAATNSGGRPMEARAEVEGLTAKTIELKLTRWRRVKRVWDKLQVRGQRTLYEYTTQDGNGKRVMRPASTKQATPERPTKRRHGQDGDDDGGPAEATRQADEGAVADSLNDRGGASRDGNGSDSDGREESKHGNTTPTGAATSGRVAKSRSSSARKAKRQMRDESKSGGGRRYQQATLDRLWAPKRKRKVDTAIDFGDDPDDIIDLIDGAAASKVAKVVTEHDGAAVGTDGDGSETGAVGRKRQRETGQLGELDETAETESGLEGDGDKRERTPG